jgi:hypothetical protein
MNNNLEAQDLIDVTIEQRNAALNDAAMAKAELKTVKREFQKMAMELAELRTKAGTPA